MTPNPEIGRYRLVRRVAEDSKVWLAEDLEDPGTSVAVKFVPADSDVFGYRQQGRELAELEHLGLVAPVDSGETADGAPFFVFPWIEGRTLRQILNEDGPMPLRRAAILLRQIGSILAAAHSRHIAHGALEPEHIVIAHAHGRDAASILNFGSWHVAQPPSIPPGYLAPEYNEGLITMSGDIYSFGAVAAEMLTGRRAFRYGSEADLRRQQRIGLARGALRKLRPQLPLRAEEEIRRALSFDPAHRPGDVEIMAGRIGDALATESRFPLRRVLLFAGVLTAVAGATVLRGCRDR